MKLAQKYHPDAVNAQAAKAEEGEVSLTNEQAEETFIEVKAAFDRLVELNVEYQGKLLIDAEAELAEKIEEAKKQAAMREVRMNIARARAEKSAKDMERLKALEEELKD